MHEDISNWLIIWFGQKGLDAGQDKAGQLATDFFAEGLIDSLGVIGLISEIEDRFGIRFADTHFQDRRFATIGGLAAIVHELTQEGR